MRVPAGARDRREISPLRKPARLRTNEREKASACFGPCLRRAGEMTVWEYLFEMTKKLIASELLGVR